MLHQNLSNYLSDQKFIDFKLSAENYCNYLENLGLEENRFFSIRVQTLLADLYSRALKLDEVELIKDSDYEDQQQRYKIINRAKEFGGMVSKILGAAQFYRTAFNPSDIDAEELGHGFLTDDLQDIYIDIKEALEFININNDSSVQQALWDIKFSLRSHWGEHCISALHYLQYLC